MTSSRTAVRGWKLVEVASPGGPSPPGRRATSARPRGRPRWRRCRLRRRASRAVGQRGEEAWEDARQRRGQRQHGVRGRAGHQRPPLVGAEPARPCAGPRSSPRSPKPAVSERDGRARSASSPRMAGRILSTSPHERREGAGVRRSVGREGGGRRRRRCAPDGRRPARRRADGRRRPAGCSSRTPRRGEVDVREGRGGEQERVHRRADVVTEAGKGELRGAAAPAGLVGRLVDVDGQAGTGQGEGGDQTVGPGADDDGVGRLSGLTGPASSLPRRR